MVGGKTLRRGENPQPTNTVEVFTGTRSVYDHDQLFSIILGSPSKTTKRIFSVKGGGYPPFPLSFFEHNDFPLREAPNSVKEKIH